MSTAATLVPPTCPPGMSVSPTRPVVASTPNDAQSRRDRLRLDDLFKFTHPPGYYDESARVAVLRRSRRRPHDQLLVEFAEGDMLTERTAAGRTLWCSLWHWQATVDGQPLSPAGPWRELCWHTDADVDYLEIELPLSGGWKLQRQMVLGRRDRFVLLADAVLGPRGVGAAFREGEAPAEPPARPLVAAMQSLASSACVSLAFAATASSVAANL